MFRSKCNDNDDDNCFTIETVICKVYFPQMDAGACRTTSSCELKQTRNKEIRRFHINNHNSFRHFFDLVTSSIVEPSADVELLVMDADSDWIPIDCDEQWAAVLNGARTIPTKKHKQLRFKVTARDGTCVTPKPCTSRQTKSKHGRTSSGRRNASCCIVPTKTEAYPCLSSDFLSIKQDFGDLQKQMEAMRLQQQGPTEGQEKKKKKSDKKKRSSKNASTAELATQIAYHTEMFTNWSPSKWSDSDSSIAVL